MASFAAYFADLPDPRKGNAKRHNLLSILTIALTATICGAECCTDFADFARERRTLFEEFLDLPGGVPSHDTFSRLFRLLDPAAFASCFAHFLDHLGEPGAGVLAIDGKTLRRSFDTARDKSALHVVTAFATERRMILAQTPTKPGQTEVIAARDVLRLLDIKGMLVTADAIHCNSQTAALIRQREADWLFSLKANRPAMLRDVGAYFADPPQKLASHTTIDGDHGRIETRRYQVSHDVDWLTPNRSEADEAKLAGLAMIAMVDVEIETNGKISRSQRYYVSSAALTPERLAEAVRSHWLIEATHWVLDTGFSEDLARNRADHGPENLAILRRLALNTLRASRKDISIRRKRKRSGWSDEFARSIIGQMR